MSTDEYWEEFSTQFKPQLSEKVVIADRQREADELIAKLSGPAESAGAVRKDLEDALNMLVEQPGVGTKVETGRSPQVRRFLLNRISYHLYYRVRRSELEVLSVWHTSRGRGPSV